MSQYQLREFEPERLEAVSGRWRELAGEDEYDSELVGVFEWCGSHLTARAGDSQALELYNPATRETDAILEVIESGRGSKLLRLFVSPSLWVVDTDEDRLRIVSLYTAAFMRVIVNGITSSSGVVKIYGRSKLMYAILCEIASHWPTDRTDWKAAMAGRWLEISRPS